MHTVGLLPFAVGSVGGAFGWYEALRTEGRLANEELVWLGPLLAAVGLSMLVFPRIWSGPDGNTLPARWWPAALAAAAGLLIGAGGLASLEALKRQWAEARRTHRACGEELVRLSAEYTEVLAGIRDQASARQAEERLRGLARWARQLRDRTASLGTPTPEDKEWVAQVVFPALVDSARQRAKSPRGATTHEADHLISQINDDVLAIMSSLGKEQIEEEAERFENRKPKP